MTASKAASKFISAHLEFSMALSSLRKMGDEFLAAVGADTTDGIAIAAMLDQFREYDAKELEQNDVRQIIIGIANQKTAA